jgi:predicted outer membrane repeat protein
MPASARRQLKLSKPGLGVIAFAALIAAVLIAYQDSPFGPAPAAAATITVDTLADENDIPISGLNGFCALREAINNANNDDSTNPDCDPGTGNDTIAFDPVVFAGGQAITLLSDLQPIVDPDGLTIDGGSLVTVNGGGFTLFVINGVSLTLNDLMVTGADTAGDGGGIVNNLGTVSINGTTVSGNMAGVTGGGIFNDDGTVTINDSVVNENTAGVAGGGIYNGGGTVVINNSVFSGNTASASDGGGIYDNFGTVTIANSTIGPNNQAAESGGGIYTDGGTVTITGSTIVGNSSLGGGGLGLNSGGGIFNTDGDVLLINSTISGNSSATVGGGMYNAFGNVTLINVTVALNTADLEGGGLYHEFPNTTFTYFLTNTLIVGNTPDDCAGYVPGFVSLGNNLDGDNTCQLGAAGDIPGVFANLANLADNGGPTETHALTAGSPAINAGNNTACGQAAPTGSASFDQRGSGFDRISDGVCDIGAFEVQVAPPEEEPTTVPGFVPDPLTPVATRTPVPTPTPSPVATVPVTAQAPITPPATGDGGLR